MLRDAQYFNARIGRLDGAASLGDHLVQIVAEKKVQAQQQTAPENPPETAPSPEPLSKAEDPKVVAEKG